MKARISIALVVLALCAVVAESALRVFMPVAFRAPQAHADDEWRALLHIASPLDGLAYELAANRQGSGQGTAVSTNSRGMRGPEPLPEGPDLFRVAVIGDSFTFGFGVPPERTYVAVLERQLRRNAARGWRYEALNFGVGGYAASDEAIVLEHKVLPLAPDLVILGYALNDPETDPIQPLHAYYAPVEWWQYSQLARLIAAARWQREIGQLGDGDYYRYLHAQPQKWQSVVAAFERMARARDRSAVPLLIATFPAGWHDQWQDYPYRPLHAQVAREAAAHGITVVDILPFLSRFEPAQMRISAEDDHFSIEGHAVVGRGLYLELDRLGLLPAGAPSAANSGLSSRATRHP